MVYMNFVVTFIGLFMAIRLDAIIRTWPHREERVTLTGHWHMLATIIATMLLLYYMDMIGLKGKVRQWFGWFIIIFSDLALGAAAIFATKRLYTTESDQQSLVNGIMIVTDVSLAAILVVLALLMIWRLVDLFNARGMWKKELEEEAVK
jgi:membrane-bound metal-dependent hydrolase YbcI (DUF457 family)